MLALLFWHRYFAKVDCGEVFPEQPYPSQYDATAGKSGATAGAYMYGLPRPDQLQQQQLVRPMDVLPLGEECEYWGGGGYSSGSSFTPIVMAPVAFGPGPASM